MEVITKVFKSGNSQAILISKKCRLNSDIKKIIVKGSNLIIQLVEKNVREGWDKALK